MFADQLFGDAIVRLRADRSQRNVAKLGGIPVGTLCQWELGKRLPRKAQIPKLLLGLDCTEEDIVATMWQIQGERLIMAGSGAGDLALAALTEQNEQAAELLETHFEGIPDRVRAVVARLQLSIRETEEKLMAVNSDFSALIVTLGTSRK